MGKYAGQLLKADSGPLKILGNDAQIPATDIDRELIIMVVGETARADRFSLNGYPRKTNPLLEQLNVASFRQVRSCGTSTAISVPCMFSNDTEKDYETNTAKNKENALDVLVHAGVNVLWRDNNSSSKGVADRIPYQNYRDPNINPVCDLECRDEGMLVDLQDYIDSYPDGDIMIVLHQMGNHGPAYYLRYPKEFEKFQPVCATNELSDCSQEELDNAYDNAILYTDYFLSKVIGLLKKNDPKFETLMLYVSDHGESLGELGLYLHGMPNLLAPETQRHVPMIVWVGDNFTHFNNTDLQAQQDQAITHDNIFHTLLGLMEIESEAYLREMDIFHMYH
ncbi:phosphoethanolamine transferase [Kiloniella laminariae]|uniref:phosphoethanolamine transferase n=1 Tax=Kiloniella laminariae TaxID=454162 RepID=UPI00039C3D10|nr:sulfatase-like hydrolase/transferase [Kiloniella laminariae]